MPNGKKNTGKKTGLLSVEETNAMLAKELADDALKEQGSPPKSAAPKAPEEDQVLPPDLSLGQMVDPCASRKEASSPLILTNRMKLPKNS